MRESMPASAARFAAATAAVEAPTTLRPHGFPPGPGGLHEGGLARAGDADDRVGRVTGGQQPQYDGALLGAEGEGAAAGGGVGDLDGGEGHLGGFDGQPGQV